LITNEGTNATVTQAGLSMKHTGELKTKTEKIIEAGQGNN
jgi:hypothetical protein